MTEKLEEYEGFLAKYHYYRDELKEHWRETKENGSFNFMNWFRRKVGVHDAINENYSHIYRRKTRNELMRISAAVMGIEFSYAAETAFVSPTLLKIGVEHKHMTLVWALSPLIGFFLTPVLGSMSDRCPLSYGRRRPFIFLMSVGVLLGLILVPNGESLGYALGDQPPPDFQQVETVLAHRTTARLANGTISLDVGDGYKNSHPWGVFFTVLGTVLLDFDADACQSPSRTYLLDVTVADDHARGLSTFTIMAGLGGFFGYAMGAINWDITAIGIILGGHVKAVFGIVTLIFITCVTYTVTSFKEMPLRRLETLDDEHATEKNAEAEEFQMQDTYGTDEYETKRRRMAVQGNASFWMYLKSIVFMPKSLRMLCLTNLFCWMAHVCYSLYFTDFVGEAVFNGDPTALLGSKSRSLYEEGVRFGCWGMSMYSLSCACYSMVVEKLISRFGARKVYIGGLGFYSIGMFLMAVTKHKFGVILFSWTAGVMYSTLFTMPYLLVAHYHTRGVFQDGSERGSEQIRGLGTDVAIVSSMVFLAQFILSICMGSIVTLAGTTTAVVSVASALASLGALSATQVVYLDLE